jgi:hypothetical protein
MTNRNWFAVETVAASVKFAKAGSPNNVNGATPAVGTAGAVIAVTPSPANVLSVIHTCDVEFEQQGSQIAYPKLFTPVDTTSFLVNTPFRLFFTGKLG